MSAIRRIKGAVHWRHVGLVRSGDTGTSMIELFVAMIIMTICGSIFTGAVVTLFKTANQAQAITASAQQNNQAFQSLDRRVRYAAAISQPGQSAAGGTGDWYVELRNTTDGTERCSQLRVDISTGQLQRRTWAVSTSGVATPTNPTFVPLASNLTNASLPSSSTDRPFILRSTTDVAPLTPLPATAQHQVITFTLISKSGPTNAPVSSMSKFDMTALNSPGPVVTGSICQQVGRP